MTQLTRARKFGSKSTRSRICRTALWCWPSTCQCTGGSFSLQAINYSSDHTFGNPEFLWSSSWTSLTFLIVTKKLKWCYTMNTVSKSIRTSKLQSVKSSPTVPQLAPHSISDVISVSYISSKDERMLSVRMVIMLSRYKTSLSTMFWRDMRLINLHHCLMKYAVTLQL